MDDVSEFPIPETPPGYDEPPPGHATDHDDGGSIWQDWAAASSDAPQSFVPTEGVVPLGHNHGIFYYFSRGAGQVYQLPFEKHSRNALRAMASEPHYWQRTQFITKNNTIDWDGAVDHLMRSCRDVGIFDPDRLRGRGAWIDRNRVVLHLGDALVVDGERRPIELDNSAHVYEQAARLPIEIAHEPASSTEASRLMQLCMALPLESPETMGRLLAGWLVIAPVCGAMPWRPHLWVTSEAGSGKSWVLDNIVKTVLGPLAVRVQSKTSEAGIRGEIGQDAMPVIFDEAESQNDQDRARIQQVLDLARQASSEDGAAIVKGTQQGGVRKYRIRSCFAFSSVNVGLGQAADESRTVVITLMPHPDPAQRAQAFIDLRAMHAQVMTPEFPAKILARTLSLLPIIRHNAEVFAQAIARTGASRRTGDTIGVLLAGAWSLRSVRVATPAEADAFVTGHQWVRDAISTARVEEEWRRAIDHLAQQRIRVAPSNGRPEDIPIAELIDCVAGYGRSDHPLMPADARVALERAGMKYDPGTASVLIANTSDDITRFFSGTPWSGAWKTTIGRAPDADHPKTVVRFGSRVSRATRIPLALFIGEGQ